MKRHNVILESNVEPKDNNVLWLQGNKLKKFGNTGWEDIIEGDVVTTDRIENGAVTTDKIATNAFDSTLSKSEKIAPANIVGLRIAEATNKQITPDMLSESTKQYIEASGGGTVTNLADDEDITSVNNLLKFANKDYLPTSYSGLGRVYLRKNFVDGKNVLTQDMISNENTIYIIQYDYDLKGATITIPNNCTLDFQGGSLSNGNVVFNNTEISSDANAVILNVDFEGNISNNEIYASWFSILPKNSDNSFYLNRLFNSIANNSDGYKIIFSRGKYNFKSTIKPKSPVSLCGNYPLEPMDWQYRNSDYRTVFIYCPDDKGKSNITEETIGNFGLDVEPSIFIDNNKYDGKYSVLQLLNLYIRTDLSAEMPDIQSCTVMLKDIGGSVIKNCDIERFNVCIMKLGSQYSVFEHNNINACTVFFLLPKLSLEESSNNIDTTENLNYNSISNCVIVFKSIPLSDDYVRVSITEMVCLRNTIQGCEYYLYNMDGAFGQITQNGTYYEANKNNNHALIVYTASQKFLSITRQIPRLFCYNEFYNNGRNYIYAECGCIYIQGGTYTTTSTQGDYLIKIIEAKDKYVFLSIDAAVYGFKTIDANSVISKKSLRGFKIRNLNLFTHAADNEFNVGNIGIYTGLDEFVNIEKGISSYNSVHKFIAFTNKHKDSRLSISKDINSVWIGPERGNNGKYGGPNIIDKSLGLPIETLEEYKEREKNKEYFGYGGTVIKSAITDNNITILHLLNANNATTKINALNSKFVSNNLVLPNHNLKKLTPYDTSKEINGQTYACSRNEAGIIYNNAPYMIKVYPKGYKNVFSDKIDYGYLHKGDFFIMQSNNTLNVVNKEAATKVFNVIVTETEEGALHSGNLSITIDNETFELNFENATVDDIKSLIRHNVVSDKFFFEENLFIVFTDLEKTHTFNCETDDSTLTISRVTLQNATNYEYTSYKLADVLNTYGNFANKPDGAPIGFVYFCTDRQTPEGATNGIEIIHKGNNVWVDAFGRVIS